MMNLKAGLWQQQSVKLQMTQQLTQAITLLQYSSQELNAFLETKALENPLIQLERPQLETVDYKEYQSRNNNRGTQESPLEWIEQLSVSNATLADHLFAQLNLKSLSYMENKPFVDLIYSLDENGYLHIDEPSFLERYNLQQEELDYYIHALQQLEPIGVGARNLQECILLQLEKDNDDAPTFVKEVIRDHFQAFAEKKWTQIAKKLEVDISSIQQVADYIQKFHPRPGACYAKENPSYIIPELIVRTSAEGIVVTLFDGTIVKVQYNEEYNQFFTGKVDPDVQKFLHEKQQDYSWVIQSLQQRSETILKVGKKIVEKQQQFFLEGPEKIRPLTLKQVSEEVGLHESTVSRAVRDKYMQTPFGIFEMKYFFTTAVKTSMFSEEEAVSSTQVKKAIQKLIKNENKQKPLSDQKIVQQLKEKGFDVSRRTIAKYRDQLNIPSSTMRKRY
jgi:RNA polymerase sigma-54 factor